jgi:hypothetical protein
LRNRRPRDVLERLEKTSIADLVEPEAPDVLERLENFIIADLEEPEAP